MADLERHLHSLAERDDLYPPTPDIAGDFAAQRLSTKPDHRLAWWQVAIIAALVLVALTVALAVPSSRTAIADFFGIAGIRIEIADDAHDLVPGTPHALGGSLLLGEQTTLTVVQETAPFVVKTPDAFPVPPDEVYVSERSRITVVTLLWHSRPDLPPIGETGVGMLLLEIAAEDDHVLFARKLAGAGQIATVRVDGRPAYWIEDGVLVVEPMEGLMPGSLEPTVRRSGNVLIWSVGTVTYRLETALPQVDAVRLAASLHPAGDPGNP